MSAPASLFEALARFTAEYPAIAEHFDALESAKADDPIANAFVQRVEDLVADVAWGFAHDNSASMTQGAGDRSEGSLLSFGFSLFASLGDDPVC